MNAFAPLFLIVMMSLISQPVSAANWCNPSTAPSINIRTATDQITYNFSQSERDLNKFSTSTVNPYGNNIITDVGGLMKGGIETQQKMSFGTITNPNTRQTCVWHDTMDIVLHIKPTIFVASEFPPGTCMHNAIMGHEHKHIQVDREIVNKYAALMGAAFRNDIMQYRVYGPVPSSNTNATISMVKTRMQTILKQYTDAMSQERRMRQQQVDSLDEYERVNKSCKR